MTLADFRPHYLRLTSADTYLLVEFTQPELHEEENIEILGRELFLLVEQFGCPRIVVSLKGVEWITSAFIGKLITLHRKSHRRGGIVVLCDMGEDVQSVLRTSRLLDYFTTAPGRSAAAALAEAAVLNAPN